MLAPLLRRVTPTVGLFDLAASDVGQCRHGDRGLSGFNTFDKEAGQVEQPAGQAEMTRRDGIGRT